MKKLIALLFVILALSVVTAFAALVTEYQYVGAQYPNGDTNLTFHISSSDLINGVTGTIVSGGFHSATQPAGNTARVATLTDGIWSSNGLTVIVDDSDGGLPALVVEYTFSATPIYDIIIFAGHDGDGARGWINCNVEVNTGSGYTTLMNEVKSGLYGDLPAAAVSSFVRLYDSAQAAIATGVIGLRFSFYDVSHNSGTSFFQKYDDNTTNPPLNYPNQGTVLKEIDVYNTPPVEAGCVYWTVY